MADNVSVNFDSQSTEDLHSLESMEVLHSPSLTKEVPSPKSIKEEVHSRKSTKEPQSPKSTKEPHSPKSIKEPQSPKSTKEPHSANFSEKIHSPKSKEGAHSAISKEINNKDSKEQLVRRSTVSNILSSNNGNKIRTISKSNVTNPMFNRYPDPLRCNPVNGEQFHEIIARDPNCSAWPRREEPEFANRRISFHGAAVPADGQVTMSRLQPLQFGSHSLPPQPRAVGDSFLSPVLKEHVRSKATVPEILVTDADKGGMDGKENLHQEHSHSSVSSQGSGTSLGSAGSRAKLGWEAKHSLSKSHSLLGLDVEAMAGQENVYGGGLGGGNTKNGLGGAKEGVDGNAKENVQANVKDIAEGNTHDGGQGRDSESLQPGDGLVKERTPSPNATRVQAAFFKTDAPSMKVPSCLGLPNGWDSVHDRAIAYLSTHAPLTASGKVPKDEATLERYSIEEMSEFLIAKFPLFRRLKKIPSWAIEKRLEMLDMKDNDYFKIPYGGYRFEEWGRGI